MNYREEKWHAGCIGLVTVIVLGVAIRASAMLQTEQYDLQAALTTQQAFQHQDTRSIEWVQERNEFQLELKYRPIIAGRPFLIFNNAQINLLYRARYDGIFDIRGRYHDVIPGSLTSMATATGTVQFPRRALDYTRDDFRFPEGNGPRELFLDLGFVQPLDKLSLRIGRQQVVWGEADLFRSLDVVNPLRLDQQGIIGDDLQNYREPLWIAKALYNVGSIDAIKLIDANLEFFYSPNGRPLNDHLLVGEAYREGINVNNTLTGLSRMNAFPFRKVRHPWELSRVGAYRTEAPDQADLGSAPGCGDGLGCADFIYQTTDAIPTKILDLDASMFGVRLMGKTVAGLDFTLNYLYKRSELPGTDLGMWELFDANSPNPPGGTTPNFRADKLAEAAAAEATPDSNGNGIPDGREELLRDCVERHRPVYVLQSVHGPRPDGTANLASGCLTVGFWHPYTHIIGGTLTYNDDDLTGMIFRLEQSYSTEEPRNASPPLAAGREGQFPTQRDFDTHLKRHTEVWRSMVGFDYLRAFPTYAPPFAKRYKYLRTWFYDQWFFTGQFLNEYYSHVDGQMGLTDSATDREQHFNPLFTLVATGFFLNDLFRPWIAAGYDVNAQFPLLWLQGTYFLTPQLALRAGSIQYFGSKDAESFLFLNKYADRDTLFARLTYFFL